LRCLAQISAGESYSAKWVWQAQLINKLLLFVLLAAVNSKQVRHQFRRLLRDQAGKCGSEGECGSEVECGSGWEGECGSDK